MTAVHQEKAFFARLRDLDVSASEVAAGPKRVLHYKKILKDVQWEYLDHRPADNHGTSLHILSRPFSIFAEVFAGTFEPQLEAADCHAAMEFVKLVSQVGGHHSPLATHAKVCAPCI